MCRGQILAFARKATQPMQLSGHSFPSPHTDSSSRSPDFSLCGHISTTFLQTPQLSLRPASHTHVRTYTLNQQRLHLLSER